MICGFGLLSSCYSDCGPLNTDYTPLCPVDSCVPNGFCTIENGDAFCICDEHYIQGEGLVCVSTATAQVGEACTEDFDCIAGRCLRYTSDAEGYCTITDCLTHDECINHAANETNEMCCVEVGAAYFICLKIAEGYACGDGTGTCGASCTGSLDSACNPKFPCLRASDTDPMAICSQMCSTDADCVNCEWSDGDASIACTTIAGGDKYCLIGALRCRTDADCSEGETCGYQIADADGFPLRECGDWGLLPPGADCDGSIESPSYEERCSSLICHQNTCRAICSLDEDCPEDMICEDRLFCIKDLTCEVDEDCPEGMICVETQFSNIDDSMFLCMEDNACDGPADCLEGKSCWPTLIDGSLSGWCRPNEGRDPVGTVCDEDDDNCEVFCLDTRCTEWCSLNEDCPEDMRCGTIDFCITEPCETTVILIFFSLILAACPAEDPAEKPTCGPSGTYVEADGGAYCDCDDGYCQGEGPSCFPCGGGLLVGDTCNDDADCINGRCLKYPDEAEGYCTTTNCTIDSECVNHSYDNREMCCVEVDVDYFICLKIAEGYECGNGTGTCGSSCTGTVESACDVDHACLRGSDIHPMAICSPSCETAADCAACEWSVDPSVFFDCLVIAGGKKFCLVSGDPGCTSSMDCLGDTCTIGVNGDRTHLFGECVTYGALAPGSACNDGDDPSDLDFDERCSGLYCLGGMCTEVCRVDTDCPEGMSCLEYSPEEVDDSIMVCKGD